MRAPTASADPKGKNYRELREGQAGIGFCVIENGSGAMLSYTLQRMPSEPPLVITCKDCGHANTFSQPYPYHAGFGDQGFLYNEGGNCTLTWSIYDPYFKSHFGMMLWPPCDQTKMRSLEEALPISPKGDRWSFSAVARCGACNHELSGSMHSTVYYVLFPDSVRLEGLGRGELWMEFYIQNPPSK